MKAISNSKLFSELIDLNPIGKYHLYKDFRKLQELKVISDKDFPVFRQVVSERIRNSIY